jgi:uncharacterized protein
MRDSLRWGLAAARRLAGRRPVLTYWLLATSFAALILPVGLMLFGRYPNAISEIAERSGGDLNTNILYSVPIAARVQGGLPLVLLFLAQPATPLLAAFLTAWLIGRDRVRDLVLRYRFWAPGIGWRRGLPIWLAAIGTLAGIKLLTGYLTSQTSQPGTWPDFHWTADAHSLTFWFLLATSLFFDGGGLMEETGWRGFAFPELLKRWSPLRTAIVVGVLWQFWHIPVKLNILVAGPVPLLKFYLPFTLFTVLTSIVFMDFYNRLGGSTLIGIALHGLTNDSSGLAGSIGNDLSDKASDLHTLVTLIPLILAVVLLLLKDGERLGAREEQVQ